MSGAQPVPEAVEMTDADALQYVHKVASERYLPVLAQLHAQHAAVQKGRNAGPSIIQAELREAMEAAWRLIHGQVLAEVQAMRDPAIVIRLIAAGDAAAHSLYPAPGDAPDPSSRH